MNSPINSFYPPDTALVTTSDLSLPLLLPSSFPWCLLFKTLIWRHIYCVFTYIHSLLNDKDLCVLKCINYISMCSFILTVSFIWKLHLFFLYEFLLFFLYIGVYMYKRHRYTKIKSTFKFSIYYLNPKTDQTVINNTNRPRKIWVHIIKFTTC